MNASEAFKACESLEFQTVLDIGAGDGCHAAFFRSMGKKVKTCDMYGEHDFVGAYTDLDIVDKFDLIWCSHVLEHQPNVGLFLSKVASNLKEGGYFVVTVPPLKHDIVGGHVSLWNAGLLLYNLIIAGFDCADAKVKTYGYNISVIVKYKPVMIAGLKMDFGDIEALYKYFPMDVKNGFDGRIEVLNW